MKSIIKHNDNGTFALATTKLEAPDYGRFIDECDSSARSVRQQALWAFYLAPSDLKKPISDFLAAGEKDAKTGEFVREPWNNSRLANLKGDAKLLHMIATGQVPANTSLDTLKTIAGALPLVEKDGEFGKALDKTALDDVKYTFARQAIPLLESGALSQNKAREMRKALPKAMGGTKEDAPAPAPVKTAAEIETDNEVAVREHLQYVDKKLDSTNAKNLVAWENDSAIVILTSVARKMGYALVKQGASGDAKAKKK